MSTKKPTYIEVIAEPRYWEDAEVNGAEDTDGLMIPFRAGELWKPIIRLEDGQIMGWPSGIEAKIHYKVCDQGDYWLQDDHGSRIAKWYGAYVPNKFLCHDNAGFGEYIILNVMKGGKILGWKQPEIKEDEWLQIGGPCPCPECERLQAEVARLTDILKRVRLTEVVQAERHRRGGKVMNPECNCGGVTCPICGDTPWPAKRQDQAHLGDIAAALKNYMAANDLSAVEVLQELARQLDARVTVCEVPKSPNRSSRCEIHGTEIMRTASAGYCHECMMEKRAQKARDHSPDDGK